MKTVGSIILGVALGVAVGFFVWGTKCGSKGAAGQADGGTLPANVDSMNETELAGSLSSVMLPDDEYNRLLDAIFQTAMGLIMAEIQDSGIEVNKTVEDELKGNINQHFSREYFTKLNTESMKELPKADMISVLRFYHSEAGKKFLVLSPKIIKTTMDKVQEELGAWLPSTRDGVVSKLKGGKATAPAQGNKDQPAAEAPAKG